MTHYLKALSLGIGVALLAGCQSNLKSPTISQATQSMQLPKSAQMLTGAEIRQALGTTGETFWGEQNTGNHWVSYTSPNGTTVVHSGNFHDVGVWRIEGNQFCLKYHKIRNGAVTCMTQYKLGSDIYNVLPNGHVLSVATREEPGNHI